MVTCNNVFMFFTLEMVGLITAFFPHLLLLKSKGAGEEISQFLI